MRAWLALVALVVAGCGANGQPAPAAGANIVHASGLVEPSGEERVLIPEVGGRLKRVTIAEGDAVKAGQLLAEIENADLQAAVAGAEAALALRQAELAKLEAGAREEERRASAAALAQAVAAEKLAASELERRESMARQQQVSREILDQAKANAESARARREAAQAQNDQVIHGARIEDRAIARAAVATATADLARAKALLAKTRILSPIDGVVLKRELREGETVVALSPVPLARIGDLSKRFVRADVDELDLARVKTGQRATVSADALAGKTFNGKVVYVASRMGKRNLISDNPTERKDARILEVLIELDPGAELPIGLRVDVRITP